MEMLDDDDEFNCRLSPIEEDKELDQIIDLYKSTLKFS